MGKKTAKQMVAQEKSYVRDKPYGRPNMFSYGFNEPWCGDFQRYNLEQGGYKEWVKKFPKRFCYCPSIWEKSKELGCRKYSGIPGDLVLFDWNGNKVADHIGMVVKKNSNGTYTTVEGNTSNVSNANGNCVQVRVRETRFIRGFVRPPYKEEKFVKPKLNSYTGKKIKLNDHSALATYGEGKYLAVGDAKCSGVKYLQQFLNWYMDAGLAVDGIYGKMTKEAVYAFQKIEALTKDGVFGTDDKKAANAYYKA